ncbi:sensor histidine kinase [Actinomadura terrae]|uniref:sensor histidine kinase n=1 Tax=Actinomadura terrae TaxID=604353 RepID=UPI001FA7A78D|nr:sensor histidine kinase [Actinomadura terrae]
MPRGFPTRAGIGAWCRSPIRAATWLATAQVAAGGAVGLAGLAAVAMPIAVGIELARSVVAPVLALVVILAVVRGCVVLQRSRVTVFTGVDPAGSRPGPSWWRWPFTAGAWRQVGYHFVAGPVAIGMATLVGAAWSGGLLLASAPVHAWTLPPDGPLGWNPRAPLAVAATTVTGLLLLLLAPALATALARADLAVARAFLGPTRRQERAALDRRVSGLAASRAAAVEAADAERRRIERDLHDGAQQRLVSLAMNLGIARAMLKDLPEPAREIIAGSHEEAKLALTELRGFIRDLHPAVLDELGLDAALSGLAGRTPVPVDVRVDLPERLAPALESVAYFVVSEALTNVVKHSGASRAEVNLAQKDGRVVLTVADDGHGGADTARGSGLAGLSRRVASVDGTLSLSSPTGGPTRLTVELPCAL